MNTFDKNSSMKLFIQIMGITCLFLGSNSLLLAQQKTVTGKVTASTGEGSLPGVSVSVKGTTQGTTTGADGSYSLPVADNATLVFSYIGYTPEEVVVGNRTVLDVVLVPDIKSL